MVWVVSSPAWLLNRVIARDRTTQVKVEAYEDNTNTDCKTAKYMCSMRRDRCHAGWQHPMKALLDRDARPTLHKHEETGKEEERRYDENLPWIVLRATLFVWRLHHLTRYKLSHGSGE